MNSSDPRNRPMIVSNLRRLGWLATLCTAAALTACAPDTPAPHPACIWEDGCPGEDAQNDGQIGDASEVTQTVVRTLIFSLDTQKGEVLKGDVTTQKIGQAWDKDPATVGIQVDVSVTTVNVPDGAALEVYINGVQVGTPAQILNNAGRVNGVTVPCTTDIAPLSISVRAVVNAATADAAVSKDKSLVVTCGTACKATVDPLSQSCLTQDQDPTTPGFQQSFIVHSDQSDCTDAYLKVIGPPGTPTETVHVLLNGSTSVPVVATLSVDDAGLVGVTATVIGVVEDTNNPDRGSIPSSPVTAIITTEAPKIVITQPAFGQIKLSDDTDPITPGIQVALVGMVTALSSSDKNAIELYVDGTLTTKTTQSITGQFTIPLSFTTTGTHALLIKATNSCGLSGQKSKSLAVFVDKATLAILAPAQDAVLRVVDDLDKSTPDILDTTLSVAVTSETAGTDLEVYCKPKLATAYPTVPTATVLYTDATLLTIDIPISLAIAELGQEIECRVQDNAPNQTVSAPVGFIAALPPPCLHVITPAGAVTVTTASVEFLLETSGLDGQLVQGYLITPSGVPLDPIDLGVPVTNHLAGSFPMLDAGVQVPDGTYTLTFQATDKWGNLATQSLCSDVTRTVTIDTTPPTLVITLPVKATLTTLDDPDSNPVKPGYQIDVEVTVTGAHTVCLNVDGVLFACNTSVAETTGVVAFHDVTLQPGVNVLSVYGSDLNGNTAAPPPTLVTLISDVPVVKYLFPSGSLKVASDALAFSVSVTDPAAGLPVTGATLDVLQNGVSVPVAATETAPGVYAFTLTGFSAGVTTVQVGAYIAAAPDKKGYSSEITISFKSALPTATIESPTDGQVLNAANLTCALGLTDCVLPVSATFTNVEDGSAAALTVTCGTTVTSTNATVQAGAIKVQNVKLLDQNACQLSVAVTDAAGQVAVSPVVHVTVDRIAPKFGDLLAPYKPLGLKLVALDDLDNDPTNAMQVNWEPSIGGVPAGTVISCVVVNDQGKQTGTFSATTAAAIADGLAVGVKFGVITLPDGNNVKITCSAADAAGNIGAKDFIAQIASAQPELFIQTPSPNADPCTTNAQCQFGICHLGKCTVPMSKFADRTMKLSLAGFLNGAPTHVCSDTPGLTGAACATAGYVEVATSTVQASVSLVSLAGLADGTYHFIAEAYNSADKTWTSSLSSPYAGGHDRIYLIDTVAPTVSTLVGPSAAGVPASCLNQAEQVKSDGLLPGGTFTFQVTTVGEDATVSLLVNGVSSGTVTTVGLTGSMQVTIPTEGTATMETVAVDLVGNLSDYKQFPSVFVDTLPPTGDFAVPAKSPLIIGDNRDVTVQSVSDDVENEPATVRDLGLFKAVQGFLSGQAVFPDATFGILSDGSHSLTADLRDHCGNTATAGTSPVVVVVDTQPPTVTITAPTEGALFTDNDDAAPAQSGYQVALHFSTNGAATWSLELGTDCDAGSQNCPGFVAIGSGTIANPGGAEAPVLATVPFGNTIHYKFRLTVTDASGNTAVATRAFDVLLSGCLVKLTGLPGNSMLNTQNCTTPGQNCASVTLPLTASYIGPCGTPTGVRLLKGGVEVALVTPSAQSAAFDVTIVDGDNTDLEAVVLENLNPKGSSGKLGIAADLTNPTVSFAAATVLGVQTVSGTSALQGKAQDVSPATPSHQVQFQLALADAHLNGGKLTALDDTVNGAKSALSNASVTTPLALTGAAESVDVQNATLLEDQVNTVTATVADSFGNTASASIVVTVDWQAPAAIALNALLDADLNPRRPSAKLRFLAVGDNGVSGTAASYIVRYAKKAIVTQADFDAACDAASISGFAAPTPAAPGSSEVVTVTGPDGRDPTDLCKFAPFTDNGISSYYFAVEAVDAAGNKGTLSNVVSTDKLRYRFVRITAAGTFNDQNYRGRVFGLGDLNGDGFGDVGLGGGTSTPFCVLYGRASTADINLATEPASGLQCFANPGGLGGQVARPQDVNGDGIVDLVLGAKTGAGVVREVWVFLGQKGSQLAATPAVIIKGFSANAAIAGVFRVQTVGNYNGDVSATGLPVNDIAVTSMRDATWPTNEVVYVIPGNTSWSQATPLTIDVTKQTDRTNNLVMRAWAPDETDPSTQFGGNLGGGNVLVENNGVGQQFDELVLHEYAAGQQMYVIKGQALSGAIDLKFSTGNNGLQPSDNLAVRIHPGNTGSLAFGAFFDLLEYDNQPGLDLVVQHQMNSLSVYPGMYWIRGAALLTKQVAVPNNIALQDVVAAIGSLTSVFTTNYGMVSYSYGKGPLNLGNFFDDPSAGSHCTVVYARQKIVGIPGQGQQVVLRLGVPHTETGGAVAYLYEDVILTDPFVPTNTSWGNNNVASNGNGFGAPGDFNGDGLVDLVIGSGDTSGTPGSTVIVY